MFRLSALASAVLILAITFGCTSPEERAAQAVAEATSKIESAPAEAATLLQTAIEHVPNHGEAYGLLARLRFEEGSYPEAARLARRAVEFGHERSGQWLGRALVAEGNFEEAVPLLEAATLAEPFHGSLWLDLARALSATGRMTEASAAFEHALEGDVPPIAFVEYVDHQLAVLAAQERASHGGPREGSATVDPVAAEHQRLDGLLRRAEANPELAERAEETRARLDAAREAHAVRVASRARIGVVGPSDRPDPRIDLEEAMRVAEAAGLVQALSEEPPARDRRFTPPNEVGEGEADSLQLGVADVGGARRPGAGSISQGGSLATDDVD
ncbi:MAG: tetratricopeptide repeat protein [Myxococcota bacterium]